MSLDMMYQPYASYFSPYQRSHSAAGSSSASASPDAYQHHKAFSHPSPALTSRLGHDSLLDHPSSSHSFTPTRPVHPAPAGSGVGLAGSGLGSALGGALESAALLGGLGSMKTEQSETEAADQPSESVCVSNTCIILKYFEGGDASTKVDEHFTRSLNQQSNYKETPAPMSTRNLPASFWDSNYTPPVAPSFSHDPHTLTASSFSLGAADAMTGYMSGHVTSGMSSLHGMSSLQDPWRSTYPMTSQSSAHSAYAAHSLNAYSPQGRYGGHYPSLLPSAGLNSWNSRYSFNSAAPAAYSGI